jgi:hypothetical protein
MLAAIAVTHAERLRPIDALADGSASAPALDDAASFPSRRSPSRGRAGLLKLTVPNGLGGDGCGGRGATATATSSSSGWHGSRA